MNKFKVILLLALTLFYFSCKNTNVSEESTNAESTADSINIAKIKNEEEKITVYAWVNKLRMRQDPDTKSKVIAELKEGATLFYLNEKSDFTQKVNLRGTLFDEPWLKVKTPAGVEGWVYGGGVKFYKPKVDVAPSPYKKCQRFINDRNQEMFLSCFSGVQKKQLRKDTRFVTKTKDGLVLTLLDGQQKKLTNTEIEGEDFRSFEYVYYLNQMGYFVIKVNLFEDEEYWLVNDKSGKEISIWGFPKMAPDAKKIICTSADLEAGFFANGIQVFAFTDSGLKKVFQKELINYEPVLPKWIDDKTVELTLRPRESDLDRKQKLAQLKLMEDRNWMYIE